MINYRDIKSKQTALYLNFPFCESPCSYCHYIDNLSFGYNTIPEDYILLIINQLDSVLKYWDGNLLESIYFGGGTPSMLSDEQIKKIEEVFKRYNITAKEISIEIHPGMCNFNYSNNSFFTRYSIGVQSFDKKTIDSYYRRGYTVDSIVNMVKQIRMSKYSKVINIDLVFDSLLFDMDFEYINFIIRPETVTLYPNTKGRGRQRFENVKSTLRCANNKLTDYIPLAKSTFIFLRKDCKQSFYSKNEYETNGNIIGIGHNSISYILDKTYICRYENNNIEVKERKNKGSRYLNSIIRGISTGVLKSYVKIFMPEVLRLHFLRLVESNHDVSDKHIQVFDTDLVYLPEDEYIRFYEYLLLVYNEQTAKIFLSEIGFGDGDYKIIEYYYNKKLLLSNEDIEYLRSKINNKNATLEKKRIPQMRILVEGIDGSGKDTFVDFFSQELRKRFLYDSEYGISIMGQPDSSLAYGVEAKKFVENLDYTGDFENVKKVLIKNRVASEFKIDSNKGITILIRGLVTDKATFDYVFDMDINLGEDSVINKWDKYIVISVSPEIADKRIDDRGIPRTWREQIKFLRYFDDYYKKYSNKIFDEKIIIENTELFKLKQVAKEMADDIYANQFSQK